GERLEHRQSAQQLLQWDDDLPLIVPIARAQTCSSGSHEATTSAISRLEVAMSILDPNSAPARAKWRSILIAGMLAHLPLPSTASDGVLEINQTCAIQAGCFAGDAAGFPVTITTAGSYRLTSNLVVPNENTTGIQVNDGNVSIDLAGFEIRGPVVCDGTPLVCTPGTGTGTGIRSASGPPALYGISVRNGSIRGMGSAGLILANQSIVTNLRVHSNSLVGISVGGGSIVSGNAVFQNGASGIATLSGSSVSGNSAYQNRGNGILAALGSTVSGNTTYQNEDNGIESGSSSVVSSNAAYDNGLAGIRAGTASTVSGNTAYSNGDYGIFSGRGSIASGNAVRLNADYGMYLDFQSGYRENVITGNTAGSVTGLATPVNLLNNSCNGTTSCP
ncbi:right-handed parallel beta-helix repeat-containing protein, partial [Myxococcota bacterium]|nr:right-handed parallel beta-helix repeat-containing protein [Myxococcota bacterium]